VIVQPPPVDSTLQISGQRGYLNTNQGIGSEIAQNNEVPLRTTKWRD
jgi:hypothetical protein